MVAVPGCLSAKSRSLEAEHCDDADDSDRSIYYLPLFFSLL